jgi:hypothetical protein
VDDYLGQRLRHAVKMCGADRGCNPFRVHGVISDLCAG